MSRMTTKAFSPSFPSSDQLWPDVLASRSLTILSCFPGSFLYFHQDQDAHTGLSQYRWPPATWSWSPEACWSSSLFLSTGWAGCKSSYSKARLPSPRHSAPSSGEPKFITSEQNPCSSSDAFFLSQQKWQFSVKQSLEEGRFSYESSDDVCMCMFTYLWCL